jgi:hypothetical protein
MVNASLPSLLAGHIKPQLQQDLHGRQYFLFSSRQVRRQIGEGHSTAERQARRQARRILRDRVNKVPVGRLAADLIYMALRAAEAKRQEKLSALSTEH